MTTPHPRKTTATLLAAKYGNKWAYRSGTWYCNDGLRYVSRIALCDCDDDCDHATRLCLYGPDKTEWVNLE